MSNKGKGRQHINTLNPSPLDYRLLCDALNHRFPQLCQMFFKVKGAQLAPPSHLDRDMLLWRTLNHRYLQGDFRHTDDEINSVKRSCQWTLDVKCQLAGQEQKVLDW